MLDQLGKDVFVEGSGEVAFEQLVVIDSLGNNPSHELEVAKMVRVNVREVIDGVSDPISRTALKEGIVGVEDLPGDDDVPLPQQSSSILTLLAYWKYNILPEFNMTKPHLQRQYKTYFSTPLHSSCVTL